MNAKQWYQRSTWGKRKMQSLQLQIHSQSQSHLMNSLISKIRPKLFLSSHGLCLRAFSASLLSSSSSSSTSVHCLLNNAAPPPALDTLPKKTASKKRVKVNTEQLKREWLASLSCPLPEETHDLDAIEQDLININAAEDWDWVLGIDPDVSGALSVVKSDESGFTAQVLDSPHLQVMVGKGPRKRLDANSIVQMLQSLNAPLGTTAYIEQSIPFPKDGKLGWWSGGFNYGLWIGVLVASGFSVVPVPSMTWKKKFNLSGGTFQKDDSRRIASCLFPSLSPMLKRKKDHGRADSLLIATYGISLKMDSK